MFTISQIAEVAIYIEKTDIKLNSQTFGGGLKDIINNLAYSLQFIFPFRGMFIIRFYKQEIYWN